MISPRRVAPSLPPAALVAVLVALAPERRVAVGRRRGWPAEVTRFGGDFSPGWEKYGQRPMETYGN